MSTLPGIIVVTRMLSKRWSSIIASAKPFSANFEALYAAFAANGFFRPSFLIWTNMPPAPDHPGTAKLRAIECAREVDIENAPPVVDGALGHFGENSDTRVVYQDVQTTHRLT